MGVEAHGVIEVVGGADGAGVEGAGVGEDGVANVVAAWGGWLVGCMGGWGME